MGALKFIKKLIGQTSKVTTDPLAELALDQARNDEFLRTLVRSHVWIMEQGKAMESDAPTQAEALEHIKRGVETLDAVGSADPDPGLHSQCGGGVDSSVLFICRFLSRIREGFASRPNHLLWRLERAIHLSPQSRVRQEPFFPEPEHDRSATSRLMTGRD